MSKLSGTVTTPDGAISPEAVVELHNSSNDTLDQVVVDDDGRYTYHLVEGTWVLRAWDAHGRRASVTVTLATGEDQDLDIELVEPEGGSR